MPKAGTIATLKEFFSTAERPVTNKELTALTKDQREELVQLIDELV